MNFSKHVLPFIRFRDSRIYSLVYITLVLCLKKKENLKRLDIVIRMRKSIRCIAQRCWKTLKLLEVIECIIVFKVRKEENKKKFCKRQCSLN